MRKLFISTFFIFTSVVASAQIIKTATLKFVSLHIETIITVPCDEFESGFKSDIKVKEIRKEECENLSNLLLKSTRISRNHIDTRGKLLITFEDEKVKKICFDKFGLFYDGDEYFVNKPLFSFILNHLDKKRLHFKVFVK